LAQAVGEDAFYFAVDRNFVSWVGFNRGQKPVDLWAILSLNLLVGKITLPRTLSCCFVFGSDRQASEIRITLAMPQSLASEADSSRLIAASASCGAPESSQNSFLFFQRPCPEK
jgi:hypothetical protein